MSTKTVRFKVEIEIASEVPAAWQDKWAYNHFRNALDAGLALPQFREEATHQAHITTVNFASAEHH